MGPGGLALKSVPTSNIRRKYSANGPKCRGPVLFSLVGRRGQHRAQAVRRLSLALVCLLGAMASACRNYPKARYVVTDVELEGGPGSIRRAVLSGISTTDTPLFLGFIHRVFEFEVFDRHVLATDLERIETYYHSRGYYGAKVTAARVWVIPGDPRYVNVLIRVDPGPAVLTTTVTVSGLATVPDKVRNEALTAAALLETGQPFDSDTFEKAEHEISSALADNGYAYVKVVSDAEVNIAERTADVTYSVRPGRTAVLGDITLHGNQKIPSSIILAVLHIEPGDAYSRSELDYSREALADLGVFATVQVHGDLSNPESPVVPVVVTVHEGELKSIRAGGGILLNTQQFSLGVLGGWENKNFFGGARRFQISGRPSVIFYPTRFPFSGPPGTNEWQAPKIPLFAYRIDTSLEQPAFLEGRTTGILAADLRDGPLLFPQPQKDSQVIGFLETRLRGGVRRKFFLGHFETAFSLHGEYSHPSIFVDATTKDASGKEITAPGGDDKRDGLGDVVVGYPQIHLGLDYRDDPFRPSKGFYITSQFQYGRIFQFDATGIESRAPWDIRIRPVVRGYWPVGPLVLASRIGFGFVFPSGYKPDEIDGSDPTNVANQELMLFRGFYSGGPDSNRGYAWRQIGPQGFLFYRIPNGTDASPLNPPSARCLLSDPALQRQQNNCVFGALGGASMWEASFEVRFPISGPVSGVVFIDTSDVTAETADVGKSPHLSIGPGLRYDTPVGPLRIDAGFRLPGALGFNCGAQSGAQQEACLAAEENASGFPMAVSIAVGETY